MFPIHIGIISPRLKHKVGKYVGFVNIFNVLFAKTSNILIRSSGSISSTEQILVELPTLMNFATNRTILICTILTIDKNETKTVLEINVSS